MGQSISVVFFFSFEVPNKHGDRKGILSGNHCLTPRGHSFSGLSRNPVPRAHFRSPCASWLLGLWPQFDLQIIDADVDV